MSTMSNSLAEPKAESLATAGLSQGDVSDFFALLKPRVMFLVVFTALVGMVVSHPDVHPAVAFVSLLMIAVGGGASGCLNMWWDADIDAIMTRTRKRPIPAGKIQPGEALAFGMTLSFGSVIILGLASNWLAAGLLAFTIFFYVVIYSMWLKRWTPQNIVIGGAAGALPPVVAQAAVTGHVALDSIVLFAIIFMWTPPHFWALALFVQSDYAKVGIPMMPVVAGEASTRRQILIYAVLLLPLSALPWFIGGTGAVYGVTALLLSAVFLALAVRVGLRRTVEGDTMRPEKQLFAWSVIYLFALFAVLVADRWLRVQGVLS